jgi:hypothetical protein
MAKNAGFTLSISPEEIIGAGIDKSGDYKYASIGIKKGADEYIRISYEWKEGAPEFVMAILNWVSASQDDLQEGLELSHRNGKVVSIKSDEYTALENRIKGDDVL